MAVITDFESYPAWVKGMSEASVVARDGDGRPAQVRFSLDVPPIKDRYTLAYAYVSDLELTWTLTEATLLKSLDGVYRLAANADGSTTVTYELTLDLSLPIIGLLKRKGERILIDTALKGLKARVQALS